MPADSVEEMAEALLRASLSRGPPPSSLISVGWRRPSVQSPELRRLIEQLKMETQRPLRR